MNRNLILIILYGIGCVLNFVLALRSWNDKNFSSFMGWVNSLILSLTLLLQRILS